ncbi:hypothetical protein ACQPVP_04605 [Clostridium nigeriense]|uniref:hypothetical protein n=1 Tax=Clostridium nigeriense TaxID=1805470 RepID=UPI003D3527B7
MKKKVFLFFMFFLLSLNLASCTQSESLTEDNSNNQVESTLPSEETQEPEVPTVFEALGKTYSSSKNLSEIKIGTNIYDDQQSLHYTPGEYKELDFTNDLLYLYLNEDSSVYNYLVSYDTTSENGYIPITNEDREKLIKDLNSLREQMELSSGQKMVVRLDKVTYEGPSSETNTGATFKIRVAISRVGATVVPWNYFTVTIFEEGNKLFAYLF